MGPQRSNTIGWLTALALVGGAGCASSSGRFVWVDEYTAPPPAEDARLIGIGDVLDVRVLGQDQLSARTPVRIDGFITMPFINDVQAAGRTPTVLSAEIADRLKDYVKTPVVTVGVEKATPAPVSALGEVRRPGKYDWNPDMTMLDVLALVGGLTEFGHDDRVYVLRGRPVPTRIRFDMERVLRGEGRGAGFLLEPGDVIVAE